jgi:hypothetical protein
MINQREIVAYVVGAVLIAELVKGGNGLGGQRRTAE